MRSQRLRRLQEDIERQIDAQRDKDLAAMSDEELDARIAELDPEWAAKIRHYEELEKTDPEAASLYLQQLSAEVKQS